MSVPGIDLTGTVQRVAVGIGLRSGVSTAGLRSALRECMARADVGPRQIVVIVTAHGKQDEPAVAELAGLLSVPICTVPAETLAQQHVPNPSATVARIMGTASVAEAAVIAAGAELIAPKHAGRGVTIALGVLPPDPRPRQGEQVTSNDLLSSTIAAVHAPDGAVLAAARDRQDRLTKPRGSLGVLEDVSVRLAGMANACPPPMPSPAAVAVFAADHGVHAQGVSPWPQEVSGQMVANFLAGGAAVNAFASHVGAAVVVVDVGLATPLDGLVPPGAIAPSAAEIQPGEPRLLERRVRSGTDDLSQAVAMSRQEAVTAIEAGITVARELTAGGYRCLLTGDMGIANTTASAVLIAAFTGSDPAGVTGRGTGIDDATYAHKVAIVGSALERHAAVIAAADPIEVLAAVGGLEHAAIAGYILGAAASGTPVILDGVIAGASALVARALAPDAVQFCVAGHRSAEPGHTVALTDLGLTPLVDLELRLGEGTGAVLALPIVQSAVAVLREMATFDSAGVTEKET